MLCALFMAMVPLGWLVSKVPFSYQPWNFRFPPSVPRRPLIGWLDGTENLAEVFSSYHPAPVEVACGPDTTSRCWGMYVAVMLVSLLTKRVRLAVTAPSYQWSNRNRVPASTGTMLGRVMLWLPNMTGTCAGPARCFTPSTDMVTAAGTIMVKVAAVSRIANGTLLVEPGISFPAWSTRTAVMFRFQAPNGCVSPNIPPIRNVSCSDPEPAGMFIRQRAASGAELTHGRDDDDTIPGTMVCGVLSASSMPTSTEFPATLSL